METEKREPFILNSDNRGNVIASLAEINELIERAYKKGREDAENPNYPDYGIPYIHWSVVEHPQPLHEKNYGYLLNW